MVAKEAESEQSLDSFKTQLDQAAVDERERQQPKQPNPIVEKSECIPRPVVGVATLTLLAVTEYIPAVSKIIGGKESEPPEPQQSNVPGPPNRPDHDHNIEEFVRDQHRSNKSSGDLGSIAKD